MMKSSAVWNRSRTWLGATGVVLALGATCVYAEVMAPTKHEHEIARNVSGVLQAAHISQHKVDDSMSERMHTQFLRMFDPLKLYFLQSDIDKFNESLRKHDDNVLNGEVKFAFDVYAVFKSRLDERMSWVRKFVKDDYDFSAPETITVDPLAAEYAKTVEESQERWRRRVKYDLVTLVIDDKTIEEARDRVEKRYRTLERYWNQITNNDLLEMYLTALTNSYDPHSTYMSGDTWEDFLIGMNLSLEGIGALLSTEDGVTTIKEIVPGGACDLDGRLKPGDKIVGVRGADGEMVDVVEMRLRDVVKLIRGKAGTVVALEVVPEATNQRAIYELVRQKIELKDREAQGKVLETKSGPAGENYRVGVIELRTFYANDEAVQAGDPNAATVTNHVRKILEKFNQEGVDGVVVDLRGNPGGPLSEAIGLTGLFIDKGPVVQVKNFQGDVKPYDDEIPGVVYDGPLVVLVSKTSASASEIFAGAIQDYGRGIVVGDSSTHGKGTVQRVLDLDEQFRRRMNPFAGEKPSWGALKVTMQRFYRVNGDSTQNIGVSSDIVLPSVSDHEDFSEGKLDYALNFDRIKEARFAPMSVISRNLTDQLAQLSEKRRSDSEEWKKILDRTELANELRDRTALEFNEESLRAERKRLDEEKTQEDGVDESEDGEVKEKEFGTDPYTQEVLAITADYIRLGESVLTSR